MKTLKINKPCPKGGSKMFVDEEGNLHACRLQYYINTAKHLKMERLQFNDTIIHLHYESN